MEKVWECGLMCSRDGAVEEWNIGIEGPFVMACDGFGELLFHIEARLRLIYRIERHVGAGVQWHVC